MKMKMCWILLMLLALGGGVFAEEPELAPEEIAWRTFNRSEGVDKTAVLTLKIERRGATRTRVAQIYSQYKDHTEKTLIRFTTPPEVAGFSFLSYERKDSDRPGEQWIYLPASKRVMRIAGNDRRSAFMDSDFSYEDLSGQNPKDSKHRLLGKEKINGGSCYILESVALQREMTYSKTVAWIDTESFIMRRAELYDKSGELQKVLIVSDLVKIDGIFTALSFNMKNFKKQSQSTLSFSKVAFNQNLDDQLFSERSLMNR